MALDCNTKTWKNLTYLRFTVKMSVENEITMGVCMKN